MPKKGYAIHHAPGMAQLHAHAAGRKLRIGLLDRERHGAMKAVDHEAGDPNVEAIVVSAVVLHPEVEGVRQARTQSITGEQIGIQIARA